MSVKTRTDNGRASKAAAAEKPAGMEIPEIDFRPVILDIVGVSPLIQKQWSTKVQAQLEARSTKKAKPQRGERVPEEEWRSAAYVIPGCEEMPDWTPGKYRHPASAFKHAFMYGIKQLDDTKNFPATRASGWVFTKTDPVLEFSNVVLRTDIGRPVQPIYRPMFMDWSCDLAVDYNAGALSLEQVVAIFDLGGYTGGIGEWRPSSPKNKTGSFGRFRVRSVRAA